MFTTIGKKCYRLVTSRILRIILHEISSWLLFLFLLVLLLFVSSSLGYGFMFLLFVISLLLFIWHKWESTTSRKIDKLTTKANRYYVQAIEEIGYEIYGIKKNEQDNTDFLIHIVKMTNLYRKLRIRFAEDKQQLYSIATDWYRYCEAIWKRDSGETIKEVEIKFKQNMLFP